jgi:hypothetical protein
VPGLKTYDLFISHAWKYSSGYNRIVGMLKEAPYFYWRNYSCPREDPAVDPEARYSKATLLSELDAQIRPVNCVLVLAGMYAAHSEWIQAEINIARKYNKPIVGVRPWASQVVPITVSGFASAMVGWNTPTIVQAIRDYSL